MIFEISSQKNETHINKPSLEMCPSHPSFLNISEAKTRQSYPDLMRFIQYWLIHWADLQTAKTNSNVIDESNL
jgi:hypothetical protein